MFDQRDSTVGVIAEGGLAARGGGDEPKEGRVSHTPFMNSPRVNATTKRTSFALRDIADSWRFVVTGRYDFGFLVGTNSD